jgi:predicted hotdog family 3-hydroxylacyl-ACP dehydratase
MVLNHLQIAERIPHAGNMCLLHIVSAWDVNTVTASAISHRESNNPLRSAQGLGIAAGIEYAAQAIAVHGSLVSAGHSVRPGMLVSARNIQTQVRWLHLIESEILIQARKIMGDDSGLVYDFEISAGQQSLLTGRASIALF